MSLLTVQIPYILLRQTFDHMSLLDTGIFVLFTSFIQLSSYCLALRGPPTLLAVPISYHVPWPVAAVFLAFLTYGSTVASFALIYRLSPFHPLAKYPGPAIAKTSKLWAAYVGTKGDLHRYYKSLHDRYGDVVRVGPNELSIRDVSLIHPILGHGGLPKGPRWGDGRDGPPALISQRDPRLHMEQRKQWNRAFSSTAMREYETIVAKRVRQLVGCLEDMIKRSDKKANTMVDMNLWLKFFATDLIGDIAFGGGFEFMKAGRDVDGIWTALETGFCISAILSHIPWVLYPFLAIARFAARRNPTAVRAEEFCRERALERLRMGTNRKDIFYYLSGEELSEAERPSQAQLVQDGELAIIAGSDTTRSVLTAALYYLLHNLAAYDRLQEEVDGTFPSGEEPLDVTKLGQMKWLNGCINEALRLQPPVPSGSERTASKGKGTKVLGNLIFPEETQLVLHTYSIHRDPRNFHSPDAFLPERWFHTSEPIGEHNTAAFFPFSYGPANCAGKNLALMEMRTLLCWLLRRFRFSKAPGVRYEEWEMKILDWFLVHQDPLFVNVSPRE